tara:strand:+ start:301 stop:501 length:201 start_codon:yes stop_codon:yes gene_type:complete
MDLTLEQVAGILTKTEDEVMFLVQSNRLRAGMVENDRSFSWTFQLDDVLKIKAELESELEEDDEEM